MRRNQKGIFQGTLKTSRIVGPTQLRGGHLCNMLAVIGPCGWFPEHVFAAPRANVVHVIAPRWIHDPWKPGPIFLQDSGTSSSKKRNHRIGAMPGFGDKNNPGKDVFVDMISVDLLLPPKLTFDLNARRLGGPSNFGDEMVAARLCHLYGQRATFVASSDSSLSLIIDTSETGNKAVRRIRVEELEPGHYLLLRTSGGGDFIAPLADRIMGNLAKKRRAEQIEWKKMIISAAVARFGQVNRRELCSLISAELKLQNLSQAHKSTVHYWISSKCIRPRKIEDFIAIMAFADREGRSQELWEAMGDIDRAHRLAGHAIRRRLLQEIAKTSLESLERDGEMVFELSDEGGGAISAFQITDIVNEVYEVPFQKIGLLLEMEE